MLGFGGGIPSNPWIKSSFSLETYIQVILYLSYLTPNSQLKNGIERGRKNDKIKVEVMCNLQRYPNFSPSTNGDF